MLTNITICSWAIVIGLCAYGIRRGTSLVLCTGILLVFAGLASALLAPSISDAIPLGRPGSPASLGAWSLLLFALLAIPTFPLGAFINRFFQWSFDPFDRPLGFLLGAITATVVVHISLSAMLCMYTGAPEYRAFNKLFVVRQFVRLEGYQALSEWITSLSSPDPSIVPARSNEPTNDNVL